MPDLTVTITAIENGVLESFYATAQDGAENAIRRLVRVRARQIIEESSSALDPRKMDDQGLRDELLVVQAEVPTFCERFPDDPSCA